MQAEDVSRGTFPRQNSGRFPGTRLGNRSGHGTRWSRTTTLPRRARTANPSSASGAAGQGRSSGGSLTRSLAPTARNGAAHSAVTAGGPKPRATAAWWRPRSPGSRPSTSARPPPIRTRSSIFSLEAAWARNRARRPLASTRSHSVSTQASASGRPGTPPPLPRSTADAGGRPSQAVRNPSAWARWSSTGPGPRKPSSRASSRISRSREVGEWSVSPDRRRQA